MATQAIGITVSRIAQVTVKWTCTPSAWTTAAIGNTITAEMTPWTAPESTFAIATSQMGHGACTRSSISRVNPNSVAIGSATTGYLGT